jgi:uracil-DNA glycosylase
LIDKTKHLILTAAHPSPLSAHNGFMGCKHFSKANEWLLQKGLTPIDWNLNEADQ